MSAKWPSKIPMQTGTFPRFESARPVPSTRPAVRLSRPPSLRPSAVLPVACRVLVIDDDEMVRRALVRGLRRRHLVTDLRDAESGLALIASGARFDAIFCDLNLGGMSGLEFFAQLEALDASQAGRVVILSGGLAGDEGEGAGGPRFLEKPASMATLEATVAELARRGVRAA